MDRHVSMESTGTEALDAVIGNGVSIANTLILLDENGTSEYYIRPIQKCYIAEGIDRSQKLFLAGPESRKIRTLLNGLPTKNEKKMDDGGFEGGRKGKNEHEEEFRIAWRYRTAPMVDSSIKGSYLMANGGVTPAGKIGSDSVGGTKFDLARVNNDYNADYLMQSGAITLHDWENRQPSFGELWDKIREFIRQSEKNDERRQKGGGLVRIVVAELSSPVWADSHLIIQFFALIKAHCRSFNLTVLLSMDSSLLGGSDFINSLHPYVDASFQLQKMDENEQKALCLRHTIDGGRFYIYKLPTIRSAAPAVLPTSLDLLFSIKKHFFEIKFLHLPPALGVEDGRSKANPGKMSCQSLADQF